MQTVEVALRSWQENDARGLYEMCLDDTVRKSGICFYDSPEESLDTINFWKKDPGSKVITDRQNQAFMGFINLCEMNRYDGYM